MIPVAVKPCRFPTLTDHLRRCELYGIPDDHKREGFREFMSSGRRPATLCCLGPTRCPTSPSASRRCSSAATMLEAIEAALKRYEGRVAITALHGLRGAVIQSRIWKFTASFWGPHP